VPTRAAAERLRGRYLEATVDRDAVLAPGQAFWHEVIGSEVRGENGRALGTVADVYRAGETEVYVVRGGPVGEFDVPAVRTLIKVFAPERREIVVDEAALDLGRETAEAGPGPARRRHRFSRHGKGTATP
jgi:ribosomal 30S subunit maturation factor RimM